MHARDFILSSVASLAECQAIRHSGNQASIPSLLLSSPLLSSSPHHLYHRYRYSDNYMYMNMSLI